MIRVIHIINVDIGVRIHLRNQLLYLRQCGYDVSAICSPGPLVPRDGVTPEGIPVKTVRFSLRITPLQDLWTFIRLLAYLRRERFDIVHTHSLKPGLLGRLAARLAQTPIIIHTLHGFYFYEGMAPRARQFWKAVERLGMALGDYVLSQSREDVETAITEGICKPDRTSYLGNGIDLRQFNPSCISTAHVRAKRRELGVCDDEKVVAMAGRLLVEKGYLEFLEAARIIRKQDGRTRFWIIGVTQPDKYGAVPVEALQRESPEEYISFLGMRSDMRDLFAAMDIFVLPSHGREGIPRVLMEASAMGKPIVATNVRGCREAVVHNQTGLLVPARDATALAEAVLTLLDNSELSNRLGAAARTHALEHFDERDYFERIHTAYQMLLGRRQRRQSN